MNPPTCAADLINPYLDRPPVLEVLGASKAYPGAPGAEPRVVLAPSWYLVPDVPAVGEFIVLVGPSGCGKSTLLNLVAGLAQPTSGGVRVLGRDVTGPGADRGFVFQNYSSLPWRTAAGNVQFALELAGVPRSERKDRAREALAAVGLAGAEDRYPQQLSGGMRQRLALARTLAASPAVILMDEPFGALDVRIRIDMQDLLQQMWARQQATVLFVTHDVSEAVYLADQVLVMSPSPGRIIEVINVPEPHPRTRAFERTPFFRDAVEHITRQLRATAQPDTPVRTP